MTFDEWTASNLRGYNVHFLSKARATWDASRRTAIEEAATLVNGGTIGGNALACQIRERLLDPDPEQG